MESMLQQVANQTRSAKIDHESALLTQREARAAFEQASFAHANAVLKLNEADNQVVAAADKLNGQLAHMRALVDGSEV